ncbi:MAG: hypothetical protein ACQ9ET_04625 [Nitrosomonadaceae bacterium]
MITIDELRALNAHVTYNPLGVVKLRVNYDEFWHFYSDKTPVALEDNIHSHPYTYESKILFGGLRHHIYDVIPVEKSHQRYDARFGISNKTPITTLHENVEPVKLTSFDTYKDDSYYIKHSTLHKIEVITPKCVTYLKAEPWVKQLFFVVDKDNVYTRKDIAQRATTDECWEIIEYTLNDEDNC